MKEISCILYIAAFLKFTVVCYSQNVKPPYEVGRWSGFRNAAISYTFDDNCPNQLAIAVPMFNSYGFHLTLFTITDDTAHWTGLKRAASQGHEIASHTVTHRNFGTLTVEQQKTEISTSLRIIDSIITCQKCITLAYPDCAEGNDSLCALYLVAARGCLPYIESSTPSNFMNVRALVCGSQGYVNTEQDFKTRADNVDSSKGWLVYVIHAIDGEHGISPLLSTTLKASLVYLTAKRHNFWVSTFGNVARYIKERNCLSVTETSNQDKSITLQVTDTLDNKVYNVPVTVRRLLPQNWSSVIVTQNGLPINASTVKIDSTRYIIFNAVPNGGEIKLVKNDSLRATSNIELKGAGNGSDFSLRQNHPNPFNPTTTFTFSVGTYSHISLRVFDLVGREVATLVDEQKPAGTYTQQWNVRGLSSGFYFYRLEAGNFVDVKKLLLLK